MVSRHIASTSWGLDKMSNNDTGVRIALVEPDRAYAVTCDGMGCGTGYVDVIICKPSELDDYLNEMAWAHHEQWYVEDEEDDDGCEPECQAGASAVEYTPENMDKWDSRKSGGGSFLEESGVLAVWQALGYGRAKFEGSDLLDCSTYIKQWNIPICQAGVSWQEVGQWGKQRAACQDVIRVLGPLAIRSAQNMPPLLDTQLKGALTMAENELKLIEANVQKVVARLKAL